MIKVIVATVFLATSFATSIEVLLPEYVFTYEPCTKVDELKPDLKNCSRFYECIEAGYWVGEPCNVGLLFNPVTLQCDYPENVTCATEIQVDAPKQVLTYEPCTKVNELKPDPKDCSRYYECTHAGWVGNVCNPGLEFNPATLYCDYPYNVKCANETFIGNAPKQVLTYEPCTKVNELKPDPKDCSRYYECTHAGWVGNVCNPGLEFNPATLYCDYPYNVKCANETFIGNAPKQVLTYESCTKVNELKPDPKDCSRFYECTHAGWVGNVCNPGLEFNPATLYCDYPYNVKCANETFIGNAPKQVLTYESCTKVNELKPDPKDCSRFYECTHAGWVGNVCNPGLEFNPATLYCDYPYNVKCANETFIGNDVRRPL